MKKLTAAEVLRFLDSPAIVWTGSRIRVEPGSASRGLGSEIGFEVRLSGEVREPGISQVNVRLPGINSDLPAGLTFSFYGLNERMQFVLLGEAFLRGDGKDEKLPEGLERERLTSFYRNFEVFHLQELKKIAGQLEEISNIWLTWKN